MDYSGLDEAALNEKLKGASSYEERSAIRKALRDIKKGQGRSIGSIRKREATYNRFAGASSTPSKSSAPKSYIEQKVKAPGGLSPQQTTPIQSPSPYSPTTHTPPIISHTPSPLDHTSTPSSPPPPPHSPEEGTDSIPPHTEEVEPSQTPERPPAESSPPSSPPPSPEQESPPPSSSYKYQEEEVDEGVEEEEETEPMASQEMEEKEQEEETEEPIEREGEEEGEGEGEGDGEGEGEGDGEEETSQPQEEEKVEEEVEKPHPPEPAPPEKPTSPRQHESPDTVVDGPFGKRVQSRRPQKQETTPTDKGRAEFQGFQLRKTSSQEQKEKTSGRSYGSGGGGHNFGVKLRSRDSRPSPATTDVIPSRVERAASPPRMRAKTFVSPRQTSQRTAASSSSGPRSLLDYQKLAAKSQAKSRARDRQEADDEGSGSTLPVEELQRYLVLYVNKELSLSPSLPSRGKALYDTCSDSANLCKLINKSVKNTVDLRALTTLSSSMSSADREEALQENMTLTIESARAIGCRVTDSTGDLILRKDPATIRGFLVDLIRARVVHLPGMEDEPSTTFTNLSSLFSKLGISEEGGEERDGGGEAVDDDDSSEITWKEKDSERLAKALKTPPTSPPTTGTWRETSADSHSSAHASSEQSDASSELTYEERAALRRAEREKKRKQETTASTATSAAPSSGDISKMSYEERAAMRRLERERRRQQRAELANAH